ncbi:MAG: DegT/DnrJ/EryC1/StrS family aminotransferase [Endomicrobium sp.]|nr:DegT/DnrJ/EryC1/StrS family aminotransferase [Endomicrobium sp.]
MIISMKTYNYGHQSLDKSDFKAVLSVLKSDFLTQGLKIKEFENSLCKYTSAK